MKKFTAMVSVMVMAVMSDQKPWRDEEAKGSCRVEWCCI